ncbi:MAG: hypothetical protein ACW976_03455, partial [Candidatus Ranarchaeia archaeon]
MPENREPSRSQRKKASKQSQEKIPRGNLSLIDEVTSRGMVTLEELSGMSGKSIRKIQQQLRSLQRKKFLSGWFAEDTLSFITEDHLTQELTRSIAKGIIDFEKIQNQTSLPSPIVEKKFQELAEKTHLQGLYTIDRKKFISALAVWLIVEENLKTDRVEIPSIAGHLNIPIDDTVRLVSQLVETNAPEIIISGMTLITPKFLSKLKNLIDNILDDEGRVKITNLKLHPALADLTPSTIMKILTRLEEQNQGYFSQDKTEFYTDIWQQKMSAQILHFVTRRKQISIDELLNLS